MVEKPQKHFSVAEDAEIIAQLDKMAEDEGTDRTALVRRAIRNLLRETKKEDK